MVVSKSRPASAHPSSTNDVPPKAVSANEIRFAVLAVDAAVISVVAGEPRVLLIPVHMPPHFVHARGLPGGLIRPLETAEQAVTRQLSEKCALTGVYSEQLGTFSGVERDPRGRVVSVAYLALLPEPVARALPLGGASVGVK